MKKFNYRQYDAIGEYSDRELEIPDSCKIYKMPSYNIASIVRDKNTRTNAYMLISPENFIRATPTGDMYIDILDNIYVDDSSILDIEFAPKLDNTYMVKYDGDDITSISKFRKFTPSGIEVSSVMTKTIGRYIAVMEISILSYSLLFYEKFTSDPTIANLYKERVEEICKSVING